MTEINSDLIVLGGGINGCAIAAEAALRGYSVTLIDKKDFASGASWASTKLIHGGLRYLAQGRISQVYGALKERRRLLENAPLLVKPIALNFIHQGSSIERSLYRMALHCYDWMDWKNPFPHSSSLSLKESHSACLESNYQHAFQFYDAMTDDVRLTLANAKQASLHGAKLFNYCKITESHFSKDRLWKLTCQQGSQALKLQSPFLINATGAWVNKTQTALGLAVENSLSLVKGSHLIVENQLPDRAGLVMTSQDKRILFAIPYLEKWMLLGTTEVLIDEPSHQLTPSEEEISYLLGEFNHYFKRKIHVKDILGSFSGIRALLNMQQSETPANFSREHHVIDHLAKHQMLCIYGGKITTHRQLAEQCLDKLDHFCKKPLSHPSRNLFLPGNNLEGKSIGSHIIELAKRYPTLDRSLLRRLFLTYGMDSYLILNNYFVKNKNQSPIVLDIYPFEIEYLQKNEWLLNLEDYLFRRTKVGFSLEKTDKSKLIAFF